MFSVIGFIKGILVLSIIALAGLLSILTPFLIMDNYNIACLVAVVSFLIYCALLDVLAKKGVL